MLPPSYINLLFLGYTKLLMGLPRLFISAVISGRCPHLSEPQFLTWKLGMMIVLILQTLRTKYLQDLMPGVSKGDTRRSCSSKVVAFWRSSQGKLYCIIWLSVKILWLQVTEIFLTKQRWKWWERCLISHRVKEKAEQPSLKKDLKDGSSSIPKGKNLREIASGGWCQNDLIPTQLALWIHGLQIHRFNQL